jgi:hypothetical protein
VTWAEACHKAAVEHATVIPKGRPPNLAEAYYQANLPILDEMLAKAGVRLARVLSEALNP